MQSVHAFFLVCLAGLAALGCTFEPLVQPLPRVNPDLSYAEVVGVRIWAGGRWEGVPERLPDVLTPVRVALENNSGRSLRVSYRDFTLIGSSGFRYRALPPFPLERSPSSGLGRPGLVLVDFHPAGPAGNRHVAPRYPHRHFYVTRPYVHHFPGLGVWPRLWAWEAYSAFLYGNWPASLPSEDMQDQALPEGVLEDGGRVEGFLYFQQTEREAGLHFEFKLFDAETNEPLGKAKLPLGRQ